MTHRRKKMTGIRAEAIEQIPVKLLKPHKGNARKHSRNQINMIAESIKNFGWVMPVAIDEENRIIAGHARVKAAKQLGIKHVPAIRLDHLSEAKKRAYVLADNRLAELAEWDMRTLEHELGEIEALDLDFNLEVTGFDLEDLDFSCEASQENKKQDRATNTRNNLNNKNTNASYKSHRRQVCVETNSRTVSRPADIWKLGDHRLICGRARYDNDVCGQLMQDEKAQMAFSVLPVQASIEQGKEIGAIKRFTLKGITGHLRQDELTRHLVEGLSRQTKHGVPNAPKLVLAPAILLNEVLDAFRHLYPLEEVRNHGASLLFVAGHILEGMICSAQENENLLVKSTTANPDGPGRLQLIKEVILQASKPGDLVLDVYGSDGDTLMACDQTGRGARVLEFSEAHADNTIRNWQNLNCEEACLEQTGQPFSEVKQERMIQAMETNPTGDPVLEELAAEEEYDA